MINITEELTTLPPGIEINLTKKDGRVLAVAIVKDDIHCIANCHRHATDASISPLYGYALGPRSPRLIAALNLDRSAEHVIEKVTELLNEKAIY